MKSLFSIAVLSTLLSATYAAGGGKTENVAECSSSENEELSNHKKVPRSIVQNWDIHPATVHFVNEKRFPDVYLANGVLVDENKVLTTHHFLSKYEENFENEELYVYCAKRKFKRDIIKVKRVQTNNERLAIAHLEHNITPDYWRVEPCVLVIHPVRKYYGDMEMFVVGWEFKQANLITLITTEEEFMRNINYIRNEQKTYSRMIKINNEDELNNFEDTQSIINIGEEGSPVFVWTSKRLFGIVSFASKSVIRVQDEINFLREAGVEIPENLKKWLSLLSTIFNYSCGVSLSKAKDPPFVFHHKESSSKHLNQRSYCRNYLVKTFNYEQLVETQSAIYEGDNGSLVLFESKLIGIFSFAIKLYIHGENFFAETPIDYKNFELRRK